MRDTPLGNQFDILLWKIKSERQRILSERPSQHVLAERLTRELGFKVSSAAIRKAYSATGMQWSAKRQACSQEAKRHNHLRSLTNAVTNLYRLFGEPIPQGLQNVVDFFANRQNEEDTAEE